MKADEMQNRLRLLCYNVSHGASDYRELHLNTSALIKNVAQGATYVIEYRGRPIAELRPVTERRRGRPLPDMEDFIRTLPPSNDIDRIISEGREED